MIWTLPLAAVWGGIWWRLRGGGFTDMTGIDPGTGGMRAIAAVGMVLPLAFVSWHYLALMPAFWVAWSLAGWGAFQGMQRVYSSRPNPVARVLLALGLNGVALCLVGMASEGIYALVVPSIALDLLHGLPWLPLAGVGFAPLYLIAQSVRFPDLGRFAAPGPGTEWAEVMVGAWVAVAVVLAL